MDPKIGLTYTIQALAVGAGALSVTFLVLNLHEGKLLGAAIDVGVLCMQYWVFCMQGALRAHIKEQNEWHNRHWPK